MSRRLVAFAMVSALSVSAAGSLHAAPLNMFHHSADEKAVHTAKVVSFRVRNDGKSTLVLQAGEQQISIDAGKTVAVKVAEGAEIVNVSGTARQAAGSTLTRVDRALQGNTLAVS